MKIKTILLFLALCVTMGVSSQERKIKPGNEVAIKLYKEAAKKEKKNPAYSLAMYESLAKDGYAPAQYIMYKKGKGDKWLEQAAVGGHFEAATGNGFLSQRIKLCEQVVERSRACATRASNGEAISKQEEQQLWDDRKEFDQFYHEMEMMMSNLDAAAITEDANYFPSTYKGKKGMQQAQLDMAALCKSCRDQLSRMQSFFGEQMDIIQESAKKTTMTAEEMLKLSEEYFNKKDTVEAVKWIRKAAELGHADAQAGLGACYLEGIGVTPSEVEAAKWFRKAAEQGQAVAQYALGMCYMAGIGVTPDAEEAKKWIRKSADQGYDAAKEEVENWEE